MKKTLLYLLTTLSLWANDGAYTMSGNQLIPIFESNISIPKEVLTIKRLKDGLLDVTVEYTFYNPDKRKKVMVGFEADEPSGDVDGTPKNGGHPYMSEFSVMMNNKKVLYKIAIDADDKGYIKNNKIVSDDVTAKLKDPWFNGNESGIGYVYYFNATFEHGTNYITHHYRYEPSGSVMTQYEIDYVLTAASRWAGGVIKDFTLIIDVGDITDFVIAKEFFTKGKEWEVNGWTKDTVFNKFDDPKEQTPALAFYIQKSPVVFKKKNFKIEGDLHLVSWRIQEPYHRYLEEFNYMENLLPFSSDYIENMLPRDRLSYKILKNLPFARRGYVFKSSRMKKYFKSLEWYRENPNYVPKWSDLTKEENEWITKLRKQSLELLKNLPFAKRGYVFKKAYLQNYFKHQYWYEPNKNYKVLMSELTLPEKKWLQEIKKLKVTDNFDLYEWIDKYPKF